MRRSHAFTLTMRERVYSADWSLIAATIRDQWCHEHGIDQLFYYVYTSVLLCVLTIAKCSIILACCLAIIILFFLW